ncbi:MAG: hypothetical protein C4324_06525 [Blastocatellia bacterium]
MRRSRKQQRSEHRVPPDRGPVRTKPNDRQHNRRSTSIAAISKSVRPSGRVPFLINQRADTVK